MLDTRRRKMLVFAATAAASLCPRSWASGPMPSVNVAAAADLQFALEELTALYIQESGQQVRLNFGSSGKFYTQLKQGAPFHLLLSADEEIVFKLADAGIAEDRGRVYARGRIGILVPKGGVVRADAQLRDLAAALDDGRLQRFAIANPDHAPYGARAVQALRYCGLYEKIAARLVYGENVSQAAQFALSGSTQGGIVAYSLALAAPVQAKSEFALISPHWHQALTQRMVLMKNAPPHARAFAHYLSTPVAQALFKRYGLFAA